MLIDVSSSWAVLIGTAEHVSGSDLDSLPAVRNNLIDLRAALTNPEILGLPDSQILTLHDPSDTSSVGNAIRIAGERASGTLLIYYSGHGLPDEDGQLFLALSVTSSQGLPHDALPFKWLAGDIRRSIAATRVLILDCCYAGLGERSIMSGPDLVAEQATIRGTWSLFSSAYDTPSLAPPGTRHTAFTGALIELLTQGIPGGPDELDSETILQTLRRRLVPAGFPRPDQRNTDIGYKIAIARNRAYRTGLATRFPYQWRDNTEYPSFLPISIRPISHGATWPESKGRLLGVISGRYELLHLRGLGGVSHVYVARDRLLERLVTVKVLRAELAGDSNFLARFNTEARVAARLRDPAISLIYDFGEAEINDTTAAYIVMEYVEGQNLKEILQDHGRLDYGDALAIIDRFLMALDTVHRNHIFYRDMAPNNIMLTPAGEILILNAFNLGFGSADLSDGIMIGTSQYIPPEVIKGMPHDVRSDIYATGCLLYELLTGQPPFAGSDANTIYRHVYSDPPTPSLVNPDIPSWCDALALKALAKDPNMRYQNSVEMRNELRNIIEHNRIDE